MRVTSIFVLALLWIGGALAQTNPDTLWTRVWGGSGDDRAYSIQQTSDGGYVIAGSKQNTTTLDFDAYVVKTNGNGDTLWTRIYGGFGLDVAVSVWQTSDGGYFIGGYTASFGAGGYDFYVVRTNSTGGTLWSRTYGGSGAEVAYSCQPTTDGGFVMAGYSNSFGAGGYDVYVVKANSNGDTLWTRTYGRSGDEGALSVQQTSDGGYVLAGYTTSFGAGLNDFYVVRTNSTGDTLWTRTFGGSNLDQANSVLQTADGSYIIAGTSSSFGAGGVDIYVVKTNNSGDTLWTRTYGGGLNDYTYSIQQTNTSDSGFVIGGYSASFGAGGNDFYLIRVHGNGDAVWTQTFGGSNADLARAIRKSTDGGYVIAGYTNSFGAGLNDLYVVKTGTDTTCTFPASPHVVITIAGSDAHLNWNPIALSTGGCPILVPDYLVFYSPTEQGPFYYHGYTADTTYTHLGVVRNAAGMYYKVVATTVPQTVLDGIVQGEEMEAVLGKTLKY
jgi:uncharacterized delta-60 repeat protein